MSFIKINDSLIDVNSLILRPKRTYISASNEVADPSLGINAGITGSLSVAHRPTNRIVADSRYVARRGKLTAGSHEIDVFDGNSENNLPYNSSGIFRNSSDVNTFRAIRQNRFMNVSASYFNPKLTLTNKSSAAYSKLDTAYDAFINRSFALTTIPADDNYNEESELAVISPRTNGGTDPSNPTVLNWPHGSEEALRRQGMLNFTKDILLEHYKTNYYHSDYSVFNYNSLNFFTSSNTLSSKVLIYPNTNPYVETGSSGGVYNITTDFTFDFFINPKYTHALDSEYTAGTILHHSSSYCISLVTGSNIGPGRVKDMFRIMLQLSSSADLDPDSIDLSNVPEYVYLSRDNSMKLNNWHRVSIFWSKDVDDKNGKIIIDNGDQNFLNTTSFRYPEDRISFGTRTVGTDNHDGQLGLFVGNKYKGIPEEVRYFFSANISDREGFFENDLGGDVYGYKILSDNASKDASGPDFSNPLNAEIHDIKIYNNYLSAREYYDLKVMGVSATSNKKPVFYLPIYFTSRSRIRRVFTSPFTQDYDIPTNPTNSNMSLGVGGKMINLENYLKDFAQGNFPRLYHLSKSDGVSYTGDEGIVAEDFTYSSTSPVYTTAGGEFGKKSRISRNLAILPCDNGLCTPNYDCITLDLQGETLLYRNTSGTDITNNQLVLYRHTNDLNNFSPELLSLRNYLTRSFDAPADLGDKYLFFPVSHTTENIDSNDVTLFSISNLYYGEKIHPGSVTIKDLGLRGAEDILTMTVKDDGMGSLYRADAETKHATWASVGNVFYSDGLILFKSPSPLYFGLNGYKLDFKGEQTTHVTSYTVPCPRGQIFSSSNPTYKVLSASNSPDDQNNPYVQITNVNIHDDNLNVIMKATLAQPVKKRKSDDIVFKIKMDF